MYIKETDTKCYFDEFKVWRKKLGLYTTKYVINLFHIIQNKNEPQYPSVNNNHKKYGHLFLLKFILVHFL